MIRPQLLMFDLDGTLVDSLDDIATSVNLTRRDFGMPPLPRQDIVRLVGDGSDALVRMVVPVAPADHPKALATLLHHYEEHLLDATSLMPGVEAVLERYQDRTLVVVTNKLQGLSERILEGLGIRSSFRLVVGGDKLPVRKPDPGPLRHVLEAFGVPAAAAVMIGDGVNDVKAAKAAGVPVVALLGGVTAREELAALNPEALLDGMEDLMGVIP